LNSDKNLMKTTSEKVKQMFPHLKPLFNNGNVIIIRKQSHSMLVAHLKKERDLSKKRVNAAQNGPASFDSRILWIRNFKEEHHLTTPNLVELLKMEGFVITQTSLAQYLQGNVRGTDRRATFSSVGRARFVDHLTDLFTVVKKIEFKYSAEFKKLIENDMRTLIQSWYAACHIEGGSKDRQLSKIIGVDHTSIFKWYQKNRYPRSIKTLIDVSELIIEHLKTERK